MPAMMWLFATLALVALMAALGHPLRRGRPPAGAPVAPPAGGPDPDYALEIGTELDLHGVPESAVDALVEAFVEHALERGWPEVKIIHGKGTGRRRARVRDRLSRLPGVVQFGDASTPGSGWGATVVILARPRSEVAPPPAAD